MYTEYDYANQPVVDIVNDMLADAARKRVNDIHMDPTPEELITRVLQFIFSNHPFKSGFN